MIYAWIVIAAVILDQLLKWIVLRTIQVGDAIEVIQGFFYITHWKNDGAAWGFFSGQKFLLIVTTIFAFIFLLVYLRKTTDPTCRVAIVMIIGGALGNFIDRVFRDDGVVDFLLFYFGKYAFPAFNLADSFIVVATILLFFCIIFEEKLKKKVGA